MNWAEKLVVGQIVKRGEKYLMNLSKNTTTTLLGICMILGAVANAGVAILDGDPATVFDWKVSLAAVGVGWGFIKAREQGQHEKDQIGGSK